MSYPFASLSSGLLARKGAAQPAMASHSGGNPLRMTRVEAKPISGYDAAPPAPPAPQPTPPAVEPQAVVALSGIAVPAAAPAPKQTPLFRPLQRAGYAFEQGPPPFPLAPTPVAKAPVAPMAAVPEPGCSAAGACGISDASSDPARRFHVSVRLRQSHFVRLKIASAQLRKPSQDIVGEALEMYFRSLDQSVFGDCACARG